MAGALRDSAGRRRRQAALGSCLALLALASVVLTAGPVAGAGRSVPTAGSGGCGKAPLGAAGKSTVLHVTTGGRKRTAVVHLPASYKRATATPLVLFFHGHGGGAKNADATMGLTPVAEREGFIAVYGQGTSVPDVGSTWNIGGVTTKEDDDVLYTNDLLDELEAHLCIDRTREYAAGFSNGGGMAAYLACKAADRIAAVALGSGFLLEIPEGCDPGRPVPVIEYHGTADPRARYEGGGVVDETLPIMPWLEDWAAHDGCDPTSKVFATEGAATGMRWSGCDGGVVVEHWKVDGWKHNWLSKGRRAGIVAPIDANELSWAFFQQFKLPTPN